MELHDIINKIDIWQEWHDNYCHFVPKFIESAKSCENWKDWNKDLFHEFFERGGDQCVSSLQQGYFTKEEQVKIKEDWSELAPMLKNIAESQDEPLWDIYDKIKSFLRERTSQDRKAATNRLIASLQPNLLCTIVQESCLKETFNRMRDAGLKDVPEFDSYSWFKSSYLLLAYFKDKLKSYSAYDICTYPWQVREYLINLSKNQIHCMENIQSYINLLKANKNLVLTGAPGTGKTYLAKEIAKAMDAEVEFVQFHPSYDYTDFVEGLRPIKGSNNQIFFERKDGEFKKFCKEAIINKPVDNDEFQSYWIEYLLNIPSQITISGIFNIYLSRNKELTRLYVNDIRYFESELIHSNSYIYSCDDLKRIYDKSYSPEDFCGNAYFIRYGEIIISDMEKTIGLPSKHSCSGGAYVFIIDEINRGELSKIFGELFYAIDPGYRGMKGKVKTQYQNLINKDDAFVDGFFVPENVYILATMNDIDRSVESMDFALRRRFAWKEIKPEDRLEMLSEKLDHNTCDKAIRVMNTLNEEISKTRGLGSAYQIGPAYFLKLDKEHYNGDFAALWDMHIEVLLKEYLRGYSNADAKVEEFKNVYFDSLNENL